MGVFGVVQGSQIIGGTDDIFSCYTPSRWTTEQFLPGQIILLIVLSFNGPASLLFCIVHYVYIFRELHIITKIRNSDGKQPPRKYIPDIPVQWESEVRALKSMAIVFFVAIVPYMFCAACYVTVDSIALIRHVKFSDANIPWLHLFGTSFYFMPTAGPMVIWAVNKRFRDRIRELMKPDSVNVADVTSNTVRMSQHNNMKWEGSTIEEQVIKSPFPNRILYNTWIGGSTIQHVSDVTIFQSLHFTITELVFFQLQNITPPPSHAHFNPTPSPLHLPPSTHPQRK